MELGRSNEHGTEQWRWNASKLLDRNIELERSKKVCGEEKIWQEQHIRDDGAAELGRILF